MRSGPRDPFGTATPARYDDYEPKEPSCWPSCLLKFGSLFKRPHKKSFEELTDTSSLTICDMDEVTKSNFYQLQPIEAGSGSARAKVTGYEPPELPDQQQTSQEHELTGLRRP